MTPLYTYLTKQKHDHYKDKPLTAFIYDLAALKTHCQIIKAAMPENIEMYYAAKANADAPILKTIASVFDGFEVASGGELQKIKRHCPQSRVLMGGPGKTDDELKQAVIAGIETLHIESIHELQRLISILKQAEFKRQNIDISLRLNIAFSALKTTRLTMGGLASPFGMDEHMVDECMVLLKSQTKITLKGLHFHLASFQTDMPSYLNLLSQYFDYFHQFCDKHDFRLLHLNVGGGIGVDYEDPSCLFPWQSFAKALQQLIFDKQMSQTIIRFECGRAISAYCGYYAAEVLDIKTVHGKHFCIISGGTHHFRTPYAQNHSHPFTICAIDNWQRSYSRRLIMEANVDIVGQLCTPKDILAYDQKITSLRSGDIIVFHMAGAYGWNISHHDFLCHPHPEMIYLTKPSDINVTSRNDNNEKNHV
ncbi:MAG: type III PLP-dependent enzyme [Francisellaceae bacterium]